MSGHSKWAQIKRQKAVVDKKRGAIFSRLSREIAIAAKNGGDPGMNFKLRLVLARAKDAGMPKDAIERAVRRGTGEDKSAQIEEITYEGYGPGGSAFLVETATDSRNRTSSEIRHLFDKCSGKMGTQGSVSFLFESRGQLLVPKDGNENLDDLSLMAIDLGAEDVKSSEEGLEIYTAPIDLEKIKTALEGQGVKIASYEIIMRPKNLLPPQSPSDREQIAKLLEALEEHEDVIAVHTNANL